MNPAFASSDVSNSRWRQNGSGETCGRQTLALASDGTTSVNLPTLQQAVQLLADCVEDLYAGVFAFDDVSAKLLDESRLGPSDIDEVRA